MELQDKIDFSDDSPEDDLDENSENRSYNGFQGPLTETEDISLEPSVNSRCPTMKPGYLLLLMFFVMIWLLNVYKSAWTQWHVNCAKFSYSCFCYQTFSVATERYFRFNINIITDIGVARFQNTRLYSLILINPFVIECNCSNHIITKEVKRTLHWKIKLLPNEQL